MDKNTTVQKADNLSQQDVNSTGIDFIDVIIQTTTKENKIPEPVYITLVSIIRIMFILGLFTNAVCLNALWKKAQKTSTEIFFIGITISDLFFLSSNTMLSILDLISSAGYIKFTDMPVAVIIAGIMVTFLITNMTSSMLMSFLSAERIFAVFRPLSFREIWTPKLGKIGFTIGFTLVPVVVTMGFVFLGPGIMGSISLLLLMVFGAIIVVSNTLTLVGLKNRAKFTRTTNISNTKAMERVRKQTNILLGISVFFLATIATRLLSFAVISVNVSSPDMNDPHNKRNIANFIFVNISDLTQMCFSTFNCIIFVALNDRYVNSFGIRFLIRNASSIKHSSKK